MKEVLTLKGIGTLSGNRQERTVAYTLTIWENRKTGERATTGFLRCTGLEKWRGSRVSLALSGGYEAQASIRHALPDTLVVLLDNEPPETPKRDC